MLEQFKTQYLKHYANDADGLERYGFFKKSKARVAKHDDQSKEHHHQTLKSKLKQELELKAKDHDSKLDKTVASLLAQLHDERIEKTTQLLNQLLAKVKGE